jgi:hypothetical protein
MLPPVVWERSCDAEIEELRRTRNLAALRRGDRRVRKQQFVIEYELVDWFVDECVHDGRGSER